MKLERNLSLNDSGEDVLFLQGKLSEYGFYSGLIDGIFGQKTLTALGEFQHFNKIKQTNSVNLKTWKILLNFYEIQEKLNTNINTESVLITASNFRIVDKLIDYKLIEPEITKKEFICLHISNGINNPNWTASNLRKTKKGKNYVNSYIISGALVIRTYDCNYWSHHMNNLETSKKTIGIEICSNGELIKGIDDNFYTSYNMQIDSNNVYEYNGKYYEKLSRDHINSIMEVIKYLITKHSLEGNFLKLDGIFEQEDFSIIKNTFNMVEEN